MRRGLQALVVIVVLTSGCAASESGQLQGEDGGPVASGEAIADAATIQGLVVDDSQAPIPGALVAIVGLGLQVETDEGGSFRFTNVPPGPHEISAIKLGYSSSGKRVDVAANQHLEGVFLTLVPIVIEKTYQQTFGPFQGYFECHIGTVTVQSCATNSLESQVFPNNKRFLYYDLSSDDWETMWGEARWTPAAVGTASGMAIYPSYSKRYEEGNGGHWYCEADGMSPIWFRWDADESRSVCTTQGGMDPPAVMATNPLMLVADPGFASPPDEVVPRIQFQQRFELIITIFYGEPAPTEFSAFPDA